MKGLRNIGKEWLDNVTKRKRSVKVAQLEFENDATVLSFPSAQHMKGSDPFPPCTPCKKENATSDFGNRYLDTDHVFGRLG